MWPVFFSLLPFHFFSNDTSSSSSGFIYPVALNASTYMQKVYIHRTTVEPYFVKILRLNKDSSKYSHSNNTNKTVKKENEKIIGICRLDYTSSISYCYNSIFFKICLGMDEKNNESDDIFIIIVNFHLKILISIIQ